MSNTQKRIASALVLALIVGISLYFGTQTTLIFILVTGVISIDELFVNFFKGSRKSLNYLLAHSALVLPFIYFNLVDVTTHFLETYVNAGLVLNLLHLV